MHTQAHTSSLSLSLSLFLEAGQGEMKVLGIVFVSITNLFIFLLLFSFLRLCQDTFGTGNHAFPSWVVRAGLAESPGESFEGGFHNVVRVLATQLPNV